MKHSLTVLSVNSHAIKGTSIAITYFTTLTVPSWARTIAWLQLVHLTLSLLSYLLLRGPGRWLWYTETNARLYPSISRLALCVRQQHTSSESADGYYGSLYPGHIPTTVLQKALLAVGSGVAALQNPYRHGKIPILQLVDKYCFTILWTRHCIH